MKAVLAGGGTGGHIYPAIAIANEISKRLSNAEILFIGTEKGMEHKIVPEAGYDIEFIKIKGLSGNFFEKLGVAFSLLGSIVKCMNIISDFAPDVVIGTGGYVSAPVVIAAKLLNIPTVIQEQNAVAGKTTKLASKFANTVCLAFDDKNLLGCPEKTVITGNPVRASFDGLNKFRCREELGLDSHKPFILCMGGSLGAKVLNRHLCDFIKNTYKNDDFNILVISGKRYHEDILAKLAGIDIEKGNVQVKVYINDIEKYMGAADLIITRAGATALSEIAYLGKPSIIVPSPNVAENHQELNGRVFEKKKAAVMIIEKDLSGELLENTVYSLINDPYELQCMGKNAGELSIGDSAKKIVDEAEKLINKEL
ncbi:MAG: undecaprenyldiphospho-muramoylpentapeptide beta-N-acetylglucosaminyltransferase [Ruminococcaceae bacterium]|nr:undecaprenyldiphospho-muramoylpentapeptide beta-N-acetylglucosaminyltransferase [Oscillospiraceae bacterium]